MAGQQCGAAAIIKKSSPKALYFHCAGHRLNLVVADTCQIQPVMNMMDSVRKCSEVFKFSAKKQDLFEELIPDEEIRTKLIDVCKTRWLKRLDGLVRIQDMMEWVLDALEIIKDDKTLKAEQRADANGLYTTFQTFGFAVSLILTWHIVTYVDPLTTEPQKVKLDVTSVYKAVDTCIAALETARKEENVDAKHETWYNEAKRFGGKFGVPESKPRYARKQTLRANYETQNVADYYKLQITIPFLDRIIRNLKDRFGKEQRIHMNGAHITPSCVLTVSAWKNYVRSFAEQYSDDLPSINRLEEELDLWETYWTGEEKSKNHIPDDITDTLTNIHKNKVNTWYPNIHTILVLIATVPSFMRTINLATGTTEQQPDNQEILGQNPTPLSQPFL